MDKLITFPDKTMTIVNNEGKETGKVNMFVHFLSLVVEGTPQKSDTDTFLAHSMREKVDDTKPSAKSMILSDAEITFVQDGIAALRGRGVVQGSGWYYLIDPLRSAKPAGKKEK